MTGSALPLADVLRLAVIFGLWGGTLLFGVRTESSLTMGLDMLAWLSLFVGGIASLSRLRDGAALHALQREHARPRPIHEHLHALGSRGDVLATTDDPAARKKLLQAYHKRRLIISRKLQRAHTILRRKRLLQDSAILIGLGLLILARWS